MEGILFMLLIGWVLKAMKRKNGKSAKSGKDYAKARRQYQQYKEQMFGAAQKRQQENVRRQKAQEAENYRSSEGRGVVSQLQQKKEQPHEMHEAECEFSSEGKGADLERFSGSLQVETTEGEDFCAEDLGHRREELPAAQSVYADEISDHPLLDFSAKSLLQGVVMNEILTRPAQRFRRQ